MIKERKVGDETPAIRVKMFNNEDKIVGMLAVKIQVFISLSNIKKYTKEMNEILSKNSDKIFGYIITSSSEDDVKSVVDEFNIDSGFITNRYEDFSKKFGLNQKDGVISDSIFIVDKEGKIFYIDKSLNLNEFSEKLHQLITYKPKGHSHENWMSV